MARHSVAILLLVALAGLATCEAGRPLSEATLEGTQREPASGTAQHRRLSGATEAASDARLNNFIGTVVANNAAQSGSLYDALRRQRIQQVGDTTQQITSSNDANLAYVKQQIAASNSG